MKSLYELTHGEKGVYLATAQNPYSDDSLYFISKHDASIEEVKELCKKTPHYSFVQDMQTQMGNSIGSIVEYTYMIGD